MATLHELDMRTLIAMVHHWADRGEPEDRPAGERLRWALFLHLRDVACDAHAAHVPWRDMGAAEIDTVRRMVEPNTVSALSIALASLTSTAYYSSPALAWGIFCECMDADAQNAARLWLLSQLLGAA